MHGGPWEIGKRYNFIVMPKQWVGNGESARFIPAETLSFVCLECRVGSVERLALQSRDYPLEKLRMIQQFEEATRARRSGPAAAPPHP